MGGLESNETVFKIYRLIRGRLKSSRVWVSYYL